MTRPILMTGASGFIGRWIAAGLVGRGDLVVSFGRRAPDLPGVAHVAGDLGRVEEARAVVERLQP
ncbi:hypothetical protein EJC49_25435, partial [Aquibium carbonis]